jgi:hypothetical protein
MIFREARDAPMTRFSFAVAAVVCGTWVAAGEPPPARDGLRVWLDASAEGTLEIGENGRLVRWRNRVEGGPAAEAEVGRGPVPVTDAMNDQPLTLNLDSETMPNWFGLPRDQDLPSTFRIRYVRAWKHPDEKQQEDHDEKSLDH